MIEEDIPCEDILSQINAAKSALHGCGKVILEGHIKHCVRDGIEHGDADKTIKRVYKSGREILQIWDNSKFNIFMFYSSTGWVDLQPVLF